MQLTRPQQCVPGDLQIYEFEQFCIQYAGTPDCCFPAGSVVTVLRDGAPSNVTISSVAVGDMVMVCCCNFFELA